MVKQLVLAAVGLLLCPVDTYSASLFIYRNQEGDKVSETRNLSVKEMADRGLVLEEMTFSPDTPAPRKSSPVRSSGPLDRPIKRPTLETSGICDYVESSTLGNSTCYKSLLSYYEVKSSISRSRSLTDEIETLSDEWNYVSEKARERRVSLSMTDSQAQDHLDFVKKSVESWKFEVQHLEVMKGNVLFIPKFSIVTILKRVENGYQQVGSSSVWRPTFLAEILLANGGRCWIEDGELRNTSRPSANSN